MVLKNSILGSLSFLHRTTLKMGYRPKKQRQGQCKHHHNQQFKRAWTPPIPLELKFHDRQITVSPAQAFGTVHDTIVNINEGSDQVTRNGRTIQVKSVHVKLHIWLPEQEETDLAKTADTFRVILFIDKQCNGATATVLNLLHVTSFLSFRNLTGGSRFRVLWDKSITLNAQAAAGGGGVASNQESGRVGMYLSFDKDLGLPIEYNGLGITVAQLQTNNIGLLFISSRGLMEATVRTRVRFCG